MTSHLTATCCCDEECETCALVPQLLTAAEAGISVLDETCWFFALGSVVQDCVVVFTNSTGFEDTTGLGAVTQAELKNPDGDVLYTGPLADLPQKWAATIEGEYRLRMWIPGGYDYGECGPEQTATLDIAGCPCPSGCWQSGNQHEWTVGLSGFADAIFAPNEPHYSTSGGLHKSWENATPLGWADCEINSAAINHTRSIPVTLGEYEGCPSAYVERQLYSIGEVTTSRQTHWNVVIPALTGPAAVCTIRFWGLISDGNSSTVVGTDGSGAPYLMPGYDGNSITLNTARFYVLYQRTGTWQNYGVLDSRWLNLLGENPPLASLGFSTFGKLNPIGFNMQTSGFAVGTAGVPYVENWATMPFTSEIFPFSIASLDACSTCRSFTHDLLGALISGTRRRCWDNGLVDVWTGSGSINVCTYTGVFEPLDIYRDSPLSYFDPTISRVIMDYAFDDGEPCS